MPSLSYLRRRQAGLCSSCPGPARTGKIRCQVCHDRVYAGTRRLIELARIAGQETPEQKCRRLQKDRVFSHYGPGCKGCGEAEPVFLTIDHVNNDGGGRNRKRTDLGNGLYARLIREGFPDGYQVLCQNCNYKKSRLIQLETSCKSTILKRNQRYRLNVRRKVLEAYGWKCGCCQNSDEIVLTIDHVNNDGAAHRRSLGTGGGSNKFYTWLRDNGFPEGYRVLCRNCNSGRELNGGVCPHSTI